MLNENQIKAATSDSKYILCVAGAGTGKTTVISERVAFINTQRISTNNMLCLTFTRMAAKEMKERIVKKIGDEGKNIFCNTFHSFCVQLLKEWGYLINLKDFSIYGEDKKVEMIKSILSSLCFKEISNKDIKNVLEYLKNPDMINEKHPDTINYALAAKEYIYEMKRNKALDLDMLLNKGLELLKIPEVYSWCHNKYQYVFVDEYQDVNSIQEEMIKAINPQNLFVVGDPNQCIYEWRGSKPEYILSFSKTYPNCEIIHLTQNYRSSKSILNTANNIIKSSKTASNNITSEISLPNDKVEYLICPDEQKEADKIASIITGYKNRSYRDFAILARTNSIISRIADRLKGCNIPCKVINKQDNIYKSYDVKILLSYIDAAVNSDDNAAVKDIISEILTKEQISKLELRCIEKDKTLFQGLQTFKFKSQYEVDSVVKKIEKIRAVIHQADALDTIGITAEILGLENGSGIKDLKEKIGKWLNNEPEETDIEAFIRYIKTRDMQDELIEDTNTVKLMTVHAAKGLEFPVVFIAGMNEEIFPSKRSPIDEERRLFYVAVTRAKEKLYITRPEVITHNDMPFVMQESKFIKEIMEG